MTEATPSPTPVIAIWSVLFFSIGLLYWSSR